MPKMSSRGLDRRSGDQRRSVRVHRIRVLHSDDEPEQSGRLREVDREDTRREGAYTSRGSAAPHRARHRRARSSEQHDLSHPILLSTTRCESRSGRRASREQLGHSAVSGVVPLRARRLPDGGTEVRVALTVIAMLIAFITRPTRARCAFKGWYVNGARDGVYECRSPYPYPDDCTRGSAGCIERPDPNEMSYQGRVYCTNGMLTVQDGRSVWCARQKYSW